MQGLSMLGYLIILFTVLATYGSFFFLNKIAHKVHLVDRPGGRKNHAAVTPLTGGSAIIIGLTTYLLLTTASTNLSTVHIPWLSSSSLLIAAIAIFAIGLIDDLLDLQALIRLGLQGAVVFTAIIADDLLIHSFGNLLFNGPITLGLLAIPVTVFAILSGINAINLSDGLDGLAGGLVLIPLMILSFLSLNQPDLQDINYLAIGLSAAVFAFLLINFRFPWRDKATAFLGDSGSTSIGFLLSCLLIKTSQINSAHFPPVLALWLFAIPLLDTASVIVSRLRRKSSPFKPARDHLHHLLFDKGFNVMQTVLIIYTSASCFALFALLASRAGVSESFLFIAFLGLLGLHTWVMSDLSRPTAKTFIGSQVSGLAGLAKKNTAHLKAASNNIQIDQNTPSANSRVA